MKTNTLLEIILKRVIRNRKRNKVILIPVVILSLLIFFANTIQYSMKSYIDSIEDSIDLKTIAIKYQPQQYDYLLEELSKIEHIAMIVNQYEARIIANLKCKQLKTLNTDGTVFEEPINEKTCPDVINGRKINNSDEDVVIVPSKIYADSTFRTFKNPISDEEYIDGNTLLNTFISIEIEGDKKVLSKSFKVIGIYDSERYNNTKSIYMPKSAIKEVNKELNCEFSEFCMRIVVDEMDNYEKIKSKLVASNLLSTSNIVNEASKGTNTEQETRKLLYTTDINIETQQIVKRLMYFFAISSVIVLAIFIIVTNISKTFISKEELGILKIEGYKDKEIQKITIFENIFVCAIGITTALILYSILIFIGNIILNYIVQINSVGINFNKIQEQLFYIKDIPPKINFGFVIIFSLVLIFIETINTYFINKRIMNKNITNILK